MRASGAVPKAPLCLWMSPFDVTVNGFMIIKKIKNIYTYIYICISCLLTLYIYIFDIIYIYIYLLLIHF